jgi:hypothetical protein
MNQERTRFVRNEKNDQTAKVGKWGQTRKLYDTPTLIMYGNIEEITQGLFGGNDDEDNTGDSAP